MSTKDLLQVNRERLLDQYTSNLQAVLALQATIITDILPSVVDELELSPEATEWAKEWLEDTQTLFRISRRNNFTRSFAMESIRRNLVWRLNNLWPLTRLEPIPMLHCLPEDTLDPFGRPILLVEALPLGTPSDIVKPVIINIFERLRCHLRSINASALGTSPILQYIVLLDLKGFSLKSFDINVLTWVIQEAIPLFPGTLAGVFMVNYSWVHSGIWSVIKRILPASALSRVFFTSNEELLQVFTPSSLPKDYGGTLPALGLLDDPLRRQLTTLQETVTKQDEIPADSLPSTSHIPTFTSLPPTSLLNPFFGYPVSSSHGSLSFHHGRRRKRDLARTLFVLFWNRWRRPLFAGALLVIFFKLGAAAMRTAHSRYLRSLLYGKALLSFNASSK